MDEQYWDIGGSVTCYRLSIYCIRAFGALFKLCLIAQFNKPKPSAIRWRIKRWSIDIQSRCIKKIWSPYACCRRHCLASQERSTSRRNNESNSDSDEVLDKQPKWTIIDEASNRWNLVYFNYQFSLYLFLFVTFFLFQWNGLFDGLGQKFSVKRCSKNGSVSWRFMVRSGKQWCKAKRLQREDQVLPGRFDHTYKQKPRVEVKARIVTEAKAKTNKNCLLTRER